MLWYALFSVFLAGPDAAAPSLPSRPAFLYTLPADGVWMEYQLKSPEDRNMPDEILRISSVGRKMAAPVAHRWIEMKKSVKKGSRTETEIIKLLVADREMKEREAIGDWVKEAYSQTGAESLKSLKSAQINAIVGLGVPDELIRAHRVAANEELTTALGKVSTRHVIYEIGRQKKADEIHVWLTKDIPFGWAKMEIRLGQDNAPYVCLPVKTGKDAKSEVDETKKK